MSQKKYALIDLDGTLLPIDTYKFIPEYIADLASNMIALGLDMTLESFKNANAKGVEAMLSNVGKNQTNSAAYWTAFEDKSGVSESYVSGIIDKYYADYYPKLSRFASARPEAIYLVKLLKSKGYEAILATNPLFPRVAISERLSWTKSLTDADFLLITTYENFSSAKPRVEYYKEIMQKVGAEPKNCIMIGNDTRDDILPAQKAGIKCFYLNEYPIDECELPASTAKGDFEDLIDWTGKL